MGDNVDLHKWTVSFDSNTFSLNDFLKLNSIDIENLSYHSEIFNTERKREIVQDILKNGYTKEKGKLLDSIIVND